MIATLDKVWADMKERNKNTEFLPTGFGHLDENLDGGFLRKELVVLGGFTGCLSKETPILMGDGTYKNVCNLKSGDVVISYDQYLEEYSKNIVSDVFRTCHKPKPMISLVYEDETITVTYDHPFFDGEAFYPIYQLIWGEMETSEREKLKLLCEQYGQNINYEKEWGKHSCCNETCPRCQRLSKNSNGWKNNKSTSDSGRKLVKESESASNSQSYRRNKRQQSSGEFGMVYSKIQRLDSDNKWFDKKTNSSKRNIIEETGERIYKKILFGKYDGSTSTRERKALRFFVEEISTNKKKVIGEGCFRKIKVKTAEPYYSICMQEAPYTYCIGRKHCFVTHNSGKSYLAGQWARNIASKGFKTIYFSLEISNETLLSRMVGQICNLKATRIMCGLLNENESQLAMKGKAKLADSNPFLHLCDSVYKLKEIEQIVKDNQYEFVVIDFVQNIMADKKDEYSNMTYISLALQKLAKECNCCIMILSQLSNSANKTDGVLEYKGSGGIAMVADLGFFIVREPYPSTKISLQLRKNRRGMYGNIDLVMRGEGCLIEESYGQ